ncbi:PREDICTED: probable RNA-binding protein CG14230 [Ceratosolen solmsi marchali]|uniref:Probable RNA-binding protein CG14230 n=1 Tax=Ceratosolen solmsi marchali TaxID=326594 RepID=A0AAJ6YPH0_9HYME|nr:PREDICTED: probable RNA-binding protein CG14230 [Ceratosolen solmsi marchali]
MEKNHRLILKNLPLNINNEKIEKLLKDYVIINNIDLKEKTNIDESTKKFAFVNICSTDQNLQTCFRELNDKVLDGFQISVELAKESFLERLKRERNEDQLSKNHSIVQSNQTYDAKTDSLKNYEEIEDRSDDSKIQEISNKRSFKNLEPKKRKRSVISNDSIDIDNTLSASTSQNVNVNESDKQRIMSLTKKKQAFKMQKQAIHNSLKFVDNKNSNKKIIFNDNLEIQNSEQKTLHKKSTLFNSDDEDQENYEWNEDELDAKANLKYKLHKLQTHIGNDKRFVLDERFIDDDDDKINEMKGENKDNQSELNDKEWQRDSFGNVSGQSIETTDHQDTAKKKIRMVRYDPTASNHQDYEIITEKSKCDKTVKKKEKIKDTEIKADIPVPVSNEIFYDVSQNLITSLNKNEQFSLLQTFGRTVPNTDNKNEINSEVEETIKFNFNHNTKKMKYDSSDTEDEEEISEENKGTLPKSTKSLEFNVQNDRLFFYDNDPRFSEAKNFFKNQSAHKEDVFKNTRRKLKEIVRSKIRKNLKKSIPWNRKKIRRAQKSK